MKAKRMHRSAAAAWRRLTGERRPRPVPQDFLAEIQSCTRAQGALPRRLHQVGERVQERTKGGLKIEVFHSAQLGKEEDIIEQIRQGANVGQNTDSARLGNYIPAWR